MQTNKECFRCRYFDRYYTKGVKRYNRTKFGRCSVRAEIVGNHDTCQAYVIKSRS